MPQRVRRDTIETGVLGRSGESLPHALDRTAFELDDRTRRNPLSFPASHMRKQPGREHSRRQAFFGFGLALRPSVEHAPVEIDVTSADRVLK